MISYILIFPGVIFKLQSWTDLSEARAELLQQLLHHAEKASGAERTNCVEAVTTLLQLDREYLSEAIAPGTPLYQRLASLATRCEQSSVLGEPTAGQRLRVQLAV